MNWLQANFERNIPDITGLVAGTFAKQMTGDSNTSVEKTIQGFLF